MSSRAAGLLQVGVLLAAVYAPLGNYLARVFGSPRHLRVQRLIYRAVRVNPDTEQRWTVYGAGLLSLSFVSVALLYLMQRLQPLLPARFRARGRRGQRAAGDGVQHRRFLRDQH